MQGLSAADRQYTHILQVFKLNDIPIYDKCKQSIVYEMPAALFQVYELLIHVRSCIGTWGAGVVLAMRIAILFVHD